MNSLLVDILFFNELLEYKIEVTRQVCFTIL